MSLRSKIVLVLTLVIGIYALSDSLVRNAIIRPYFEKIEYSGAEVDCERIVMALEQKLEALDELCLNWAEYDGTYNFVQSRDESFSQSNLAPARLRRNGIDLLFVCDSEGNVVYHFLEDGDPSFSETDPLSLKSFPTGQFDALHPLLNEEVLVNGREKGLFPTEHKPLLVSSRHILPTSGEGQPRGRIILGRFLGDRLDDELSTRSRVDFDYWKLHGEDPLPPAESSLRDEVTASLSPLLRETPEGQLYAYTTFDDIMQRPSLLLRANVNREVARTRDAAMRYALISTIAATLLGLLALLGLLQRIVLTPISQLTSHALRIGQEDDLSARLEMDRADEVGVLANEWDAMLEKLESSRNALAESARAAGMSEIASGILHNVGNVLNSVNISATLIEQGVRELGTEDLQKLAILLEENRDDLASFVAEDPRGQFLQPYISALAEQVGGQHGKMLEELNSLTHGIEHIRELIRSQQEYAVRSDLVEKVALVDQVELAFELTEKSLGHDPGLQVERAYEVEPWVHIDRHRLVEILVNLIQNARQAMAEAGVQPRCMQLAIEAAGADRVRIRVSDNGSGISEENLVKVFHVGFTTKKSGHGFGLHSAANTAVALGGSLAAVSDGPGQGATFVLEVPTRRSSNHEGAAA